MCTASELAVFEELKDSLGAESPVGRTWPEMEKEVEAKSAGALSSVLSTGVGGETALLEQSHLRVRITQEVLSTCVLESERGYSRGAGSELRGVGCEHGHLGGWGQGQPLHQPGPL